MYCYFNNGMSMLAVADDYQAQVGEVLFQDRPTPEALGEAFPYYAAEQQKSAIRQQIAALEGSITERMTQEAIAGITDPIEDLNSPFNGMTAVQAIASVRSQIAVLRAQLQ